MSDREDTARSLRSLVDEQRISQEIGGLERHTDPFVAAVHATRMPMIITNPRLPDNPVAFANDAFCRLSGYGRDEIVGRNCRFLQGPETDPETVRRIGEAVRRVEPLEIDIRNHRKSGEPFWNRLLMAPVYDADHKLAYFFASQVDVTLERERLTGLENDNAALMAELTGRLRMQQEREREHELALKAGRFGTWNLELTNDLLTCSDQCKALFGLRPEAPFTSRDRSEAVHPEDRERVQRALRDCVAGRTDYEVEYRIIWPDGSIHWLSTRGQPFFDAGGRALRLAGVSIGIDAQKRVERIRAALAHAGDVFRDAADADAIAGAAVRIIGETIDVVRVGYGVVDPDAETIATERDWLSRGVSSFPGVLRFRDYGSFVDDLKRGDTVVIDDMTSDPRTAMAADAAKALSVASLVNIPLVENGRFVALLFVNDDRQRRWSDEEVAFVREMAERTRAATERRRAEHDLAELAASLERQVAERTSELMAAEDALRQSQKMEAVGQLTGGLAHDFNNLLTVIRGSVDLLRRPDVSEARRVRYIDAIADTADRAARLTSQLLAFARRQALKPEVFDAHGSVSALGDMLHTLVGSRIAIEVAAASDACWVDADRSQFDTAIVNMAVNARDAMDGEGKLTITVGNAEDMPAVRSHPAMPGSYVTVKVADTGTGIAPDQLERIFEPFFTTKGVGEGTGLGLSQVFGFAKQSGGEVVVCNNDGPGATFILYLPRVGPPETQGVGPDQVDRKVEGGGLCVLVVEDNAEVGTFATEALAELGYGAVLATDARQALEMLGPDGHGFDAVFSDVMMPGMTGIELGERIRSFLPDMPVILTSGYSSVLSASGAQGIDLLHKPYSIEELAEVLRRVTARIRDQAAT